LVPRNLWAKAQSLSEIGVEELAWRPNDAAQVMELLRQTEIAVLGGDVYVKPNGRFEASYENWYAERDQHEMPSTFASRSRSIASEYLANLMKPGLAECWVTLVLSEPMEPADEDDLASDLS